MQDRFKFRIYCKSENKMMLFNNPTLVDGDILQGGLLFKNYDHKIKNVHEVKPEDLILMQCTGLKDKNGKLIFEGDILRVIGNRDTSGYGVVEYLQAGCQFFVNGYLNNPSPYHPRKKGEFYQQLQEWLCTEVIGNIYENPELLEEEH